MFLTWTYTSKELNIVAKLLNVHANIKYRINLLVCVNSEKNIRFKVVDIILSLEVGYKTVSIDNVLNHDRVIVYTLALSTY